MDRKKQEMQSAAAGRQINPKEVKRDEEEITLLCFLYSRTQNWVLNEDRLDLQPFPLVALTLPELIIIIIISSSENKQDCFLRNLSASKSAITSKALKTAKPTPGSPIETSSTGEVLWPTTRIWSQTGKQTNKPKTRPIK